MTRSRTVAVVAELDHACVMGIQTHLLQTLTFET